MATETGGRVFICGHEPAGLNDPPPKGYVEWHVWAKRQREAGREQQQCCMCGRWRFPVELSQRPHVSKVFWITKGWRLSQSPICLECKEVRDGATLHR